eukprot:756641-Pyramimonas_sp.AAC.1
MEEGRGLAQHLAAHRWQHSGDLRGRLLARGNADERQEALVRARAAHCVPGGVRGGAALPGRPLPF